METRIRTAIMSHLSDAQHLMAHDARTANMHVNFAKLLLARYDDLDGWATDDELNGLWMEEIYGK